MLSTEMLAELSYFAAMVLFGFVATAGYQILLFLRVLFRHNVSFTDAEDILFLSAAGIGFFLVVYRMNDGILRWYAFAACVIGIVLHQKTLGKLSASVRKWLLQKLRKPYKI